MSKIAIVGGAGHLGNAIAKRQVNAALDSRSAGSATAPPIA